MCVLTVADFSSNRFRERLSFVYLFTGLSDYVVVILQSYNLHDDIALMVAIKPRTFLVVEDEQELITQRMLMFGE